MIGVVGGIQRSYEAVKEWVIHDIIRQQKPELDRKIDQMLKPPTERNRIMMKYLGVGKDIGKKLRRLGGGMSIGGGVRFLRRLL